MKHFVLCPGSDMDQYIKTVTEAIRQAVGTQTVMAAVSGINSMTAAALLLRALPPERVLLVHVDHGMLREGESDRVCACLRALGGTRIRCISAESEFFSGTVAGDGGRLIGPLFRICDPVQKRRIFSEVLCRILSRTAEEEGFVAGTYPETRGARLLRNGEVLLSFAHPLADMRRLAKALGVDPAIINGQPFPLPGLAVRLLCNDSAVAVTAEEREALDRVIAKVNQADPEKDTKALHPAETGYRFVARIAPVRSVGKTGDARSYRKLAILCGGGLDADFGESASVALTITDSLGFINRVALRVDSADPIRLLRCYPMELCRETVALCRKADAIVEKHLLSPALTQAFAVLLPVTGNTQKRFSVAIRAVVTEDFTTARAAVPGVDFPLAALCETVRDLKNALGDRLDLILYDMTDKPPAAIEWE